MSSQSRRDESISANITRPKSTVSSSSKQVFLACALVINARTHVLRTPAPNIGMAMSMARLFGSGRFFTAMGKCFNILAETPRLEANAAVQLLLKTKPPPTKRVVSAAAGRLASILADNPGINIFLLKTVLKNLLFRRPHVKIPDNVNGINAKEPSADGIGAPADGDDDAVMPMQRLLSLPSLPLPRLLSDAFTVLGGDELREVLGGSAFSDANETAGPSPAGYKRTGRTQGGAWSSSLLPAADDRVFHALCLGIFSASPATAGAAVRQIVSQIDLTLNYHVAATATAIDPDSSSGLSGGPSFLAAAETQSSSRATATGTRTGRWSPNRREVEEVEMLSLGIRLAARGCLGLFGLNLGGNIVAATAVVRTAEKGLAIQEDTYGDEGRKATEPVHAASQSQIADALADVFHRPFLLRLACPLTSRRVETAVTEVTEMVVGEVSPQVVAAGAKTQHFLLGKHSVNADNDDYGGEEEDCELRADLGEVVCTELSALVVAARAAEEGALAESGGIGLVADAAAPFLERLCRYFFLVVFFLLQLHFGVTEKKLLVRFSEETVGCRCLLWTRL